MEDFPDLYLSSVAAGFPSPADDYAELALDLNSLLVTNQPATFFVRVEGHSMQILDHSTVYKQGICNGDILIVDRSLTARHMDVIIAVLNGEFTVKRLFLQGSTVELLADNPRYPKISINEESDFEVWGVVTYAIQQIKSKL